MTTELNSMNIHGTINDGHIKLNSNNTSENLFSKL